MYHSKQFQEQLVPRLKELATVFYIDPKDFKSDDDFLYALRAANIKAGAYKELLSFLASQPTMMEKLLKELNDMMAREKEEKDGRPE